MRGGGGGGGGGEDIQVSIAATNAGGGLHCSGPGSKHIGDFTPTVLESWNGNKDKNRNEDMHRNKMV